MRQTKSNEKVIVHNSNSRINTVRLYSYLVPPFYH